MALDSLCSKVCCKISVIIAAGNLPLFRAYGQFPNHDTRTAISRILDEGQAAAEVTRAALSLALLMFREGTAPSISLGPRFFHLELRGSAAGRQVSASAVSHRHLAPCSNLDPRCEVGLPTVLRSSRSVAEYREAMPRKAATLRYPRLAVIRASGSPSATRAIAVSRRRRQRQSPNERPVCDRKSLVIDLRLRPARSHH